MLLSNRAAWTDSFRREYPQSCARILDDANRVLRHEFDLLGSGPKALGTELPWLTDFFRSTRRAARSFQLRVKGEISSLSEAKRATAAMATTPRIC